MSRYGYWNYFKPAPTVAERKEKAEKTIARLTKKGQALSPVRLEGRTIARTFWGKAWCDNVERYRDYEYRLERGRSYVRSGAVIDLSIAKGRVAALVVGSGSKPYQVAIRIAPMAKTAWDALVKRSAGKVASLLALAQGTLPEEMLRDFCNPETGLFPKPREIHLSCSCPDGATCCKHVAAVLYGIGARLDESPELFFTLRGIDPASIVATDVVDALTAGAESEIDADDIGDVFGIELDTAVPAPDTAAPARAAKPKKASNPPKAPDTAAPATLRNFATRLKALRSRLGLSQEGMARKLGSYQVAISLLERGRKEPDAKTLAAVDALEKGDGGRKPPTRHPRRR